MKSTLFQKVIVIGYGIVTGDVLELVHEKSSEYGYCVEYIEHEIHEFNQAKKYAQKNDIVCRTISEKEKLTDYFEAGAGTKTLIISASNNYLFPFRLVGNENITIVNFHNALLPDYPGRNAPSWVIYDNCKTTGITWHYVATGIDDGDIIIQKECEIGEDERAYELVAKLMGLASQGFAEVYCQVLEGKAFTRKQVISEARRIYKSYEIPGGGSFELSDSPWDIYKLLRSMDYGKNAIFPQAVTTYNNEKIMIKRYKLIKKEEERVSSNAITIPYDEERNLFMKYETVI